MAIIRRFWRGWAVEALFGRPTAGQRTLYTALVGVAIAWPVLLFGIARPKLAVQILSMIPLPDFVPDWTVRLAWIAVAVLLPVGVGVAVTIRSPPAARRGPLVLRILRGFPLTVGLTVSFGILVLSVPAMRFAALIRRKKVLDIPLVMDAPAYDQVAREVCQVLNRQGFSFRPAEPDWWMSTPLHLLTWLGGDALRSHVPARLEHFESDGLRMSLYPSGLLLRGNPEQLTWAHGLIAESVVHTDGLQTTEPKALALERRLRPLWRRRCTASSRCSRATRRRPSRPAAPVKRAPARVPRGAREASDAESAVSPRRPRNHMPPLPPAPAVPPVPAWPAPPPVPADVPPVPAWPAPPPVPADVPPVPAWPAPPPVPAHVPPVPADVPPVPAEVPPVPPKVPPFPPDPPIPPSLLVDELEQPAPPTPAPARKATSTTIERAFTDMII